MTSDSTIGTNTIATTITGHWPIDASYFDAIVQTSRCLITAEFRIANVVNRYLRAQ